MGDIVDSFGGRYITADDVGTTLDVLAVMRTATRYTAAATALAQESLAVTAYGVFMAGPRQCRPAAVRPSPRRRR